MPEKRSQPDSEPRLSPAEQRRRDAQDAARKAQQAYVRQVRAVFGTAAGRKLLRAWEATFCHNIVAEDPHTTTCNAAKSDFVRDIQFALTLEEKS